MAPEHKVPPLSQKIELYILALVHVPFYRYGELGNVIYTIGKNILDGVILYSMFSMAEQELRVAAVLGVVVKYVYPAITLISSVQTAGFIDHLEAVTEVKYQILKLLKVHVGIGVGQSLGAIFLLLCFPPVFKGVFHTVPGQAYIIVVLYFLHHVCDGSAQVVEGRTWFKIMEMKLRRAEHGRFSRNFWVIYAISQNFHLLLGQFFLWGSLALTAAFLSQLTAPTITITVSLGLTCVVISKFILPITYRFHMCS